MRYSATLVIIRSIDKESWYKHTQDCLSFAAAGRFELMRTWPSKRIFQFSNYFLKVTEKNYNYILLGTHRNGDLLYARLFHISGTISVWLELKFTIFKIFICFPINDTCCITFHHVTKHSIYMSCPSWERNVLNFIKTTCNKEGF